MNITVTQTLTDHSIPYEIKPHQTPVFTCEDAAQQRGVALSQVLKCMLGQDAAGTVYAMLLPGDKTLNSKKMRQAAGGAKISLIPREQLAKRFGLTVGAISPTQLMGKAAFYMDESVLCEEEITISAGSPDSGLLLKTRDLLTLLAPVVCDIAGER